MASDFFRVPEESGYITGPSPVKRAAVARYRMIEPRATRPSTLLHTVSVITMADEPRSVPNFNHVIVTSLMLSYINSLAVGLTFNLGAFWDVPLLIQPKKSVGGHACAPFLG